MASTATTRLLTITRNFLKYRYVRQNGKLYQLLYVRSQKMRLSTYGSGFWFKFQTLGYNIHVFFKNLACCSTNFKWHKISH